MCSCCGTKTLTRRQYLTDGRLFLRVICADCGKWLGWQKERNMSLPEIPIYRPVTQVDIEDRI